MIVLKSASKVYGRERSRRWILDDVDAVFESGGHYLVLGTRSAGKSTLLRLLCGVAPLTRGRIERYCSVSLPIGTAFTLAGAKTAREIATLLANLYSADAGEVAAYAAAFSGLGDFMDFPMSELSPTRRARLSHGLGYAVPSGFYLVDEVIGTDDAEFRQLCLRAFEARSRTSGTIIASRDPRHVVGHCDRAGVLHDGKLRLFDEVAEAIDLHRAIEAAEKAPGVPFAEALVKIGDLTGAHAYLSEYLSTGDGIGEEYEFFAELSLRLGLHSDAARAATIALEQSPDSARAHLLLAKTAAETGQFPQAIECALMALELSPQHQGARALLAKCYEKAGRNIEAAATWGELTPSGRGPSLRFAIRNHVKAGNWEGVLSATNKALADQKNDLPLLELKTRSLLELRRWPEATEALVQLAAQDVEAAIRILCQLVRTSHWTMIPVLLREMPVFGWKDVGESRAMGTLLTFLERKALVAQQESRTEDARALFDIVSRINPARESLPVRRLPHQGSV